jgi:hypothetical protein
MFPRQLFPMQVFPTQVFAGLGPVATGTIGLESGAGVLQEDSSALLYEVQVTAVGPIGLEDEFALLQEDGSAILYEASAQSTGPIGLEDSFALLLESGSALLYEFNIGPQITMFMNPLGAVAVSGADDPFALSPFAAVLAS